MSERGYKVRIRPPERGDVGMLVAMIGPLVELDQAALSRALANGPAIVGDDMARGEAEQMLAVFTSLGADAELLLPDGSVNRPEALTGNSTLPLHAKGIAAAIDVVTGRNSTQPFDARALRAQAARREREKAEASDPPTNSTQPFNPRALRAAARHMTQTARAERPMPSSRAPQTRPMETDQFSEPAVSPPSEDQSVPPHEAAPGRTLRGGVVDGVEVPMSRPPRGEPIRAARSRPPRPRGLPGASSPGTLPPPTQLDGLPPIDEVVDSVNTASVAFEIESQPPNQRSTRPTPRPTRPNPQLTESTPGPVVGSHPRPDRERGMAIRERITDSRTGPVHHSVPLALLLAALLPGMGQLYNGQRNRAVWFAVGTLLVVPWIWSIIDAGIVASAIADRRHPEPKPSERRAAMPGQLVLDFAVFVALAGGLTLLIHASERGKTTPPPPRITQTPTDAPRTVRTAAPESTAPASTAPATQAPKSLASAAPATTAPASTAPATTAPATTAPAAADVDRLLSEGRTACGEGRFAECERLMRAIITQRPRHREAHQLLVDAISQQGGRATRSSPTSVAPISEAP